MPIVERGLVGVRFYASLGTKLITLLLGLEDLKGNRNRQKLAKELGQGGRSLYEVLGLCP